MRTFVVIASLILATVSSNSQTITGSLFSQDGHAWPLMPGYEAQKKWDTVKVRILIDNGGSTPTQINGYVVRQWYIYYAGIDPGACANCPPLPADKWVDTEDLLENNKFNSIDTRKVWQYKYYNW
jgi:hypothetical protein